PRRSRRLRPRLDSGPHARPLRGRAAAHDRRDRAALTLCSAHGMPVVPSGGRTGYAGGAVAARGELVLSLERMRRMDPVDELGATVRVQAGAGTPAGDAHAAAHGVTWPGGFASQGPGPVGGQIATQVGGGRRV